MNFKRKNMLCKVLSGLLCFAVSAASVAGIGSAAADNSKVNAAAVDYGLLNKIQGGAVLHCFDWSYSEIKRNLADIAAAGYTAVQTSPVQPPTFYDPSETFTNDNWWKLYQPLSLSISGENKSWLGSRAELEDLCSEADKYGIKVIVDIVANHLANNGTTGGTFSLLNPDVDEDLQKTEYFHSEASKANDESRYNITQYHIGMPDLNTGHSYIQQKVLALLKDCASIGVDGFRFDAAKHIEVPNDPDNCKSEFWKVVIEGLKEDYPDTFCYGEILSYPGTYIENYTKYINLTNNYSGDKVLYGVCNKNAGSTAYSAYDKGTEPGQSVLWVESHDTYMGDSGSAGIKNTASVDDSDIIKAWAMVGSRNGSTSLFYARPDTVMGAASTDTTWKSPIVAEVNKFKNFFNGSAEYLSYSQDEYLALNERGCSGAVITKLNGGGAINMKVNKITDGEYTDKISGNTFTVSNGYLQGTVADSGVAVLYNDGLTYGYLSASPESGTTFFFDEMDVMLYAHKITDATYTTTEGASGSFTDGESISVGKTLGIGELVTVTLTGTRTDNKTTTVSFTYKKVMQTKPVKLYFDKSAYNSWESVYAYIYDNAGNTDNDWPGVQISQGNSGYYEYTVDDKFRDGNLIFVEKKGSDKRYPSQYGGGMKIGGNSKFFTEGNTLVDISAKVQEISLTLGGEIGLNYYIEVDPVLVNKHNLTATLSGPNETISVDLSKAEKTDKGYYKLTYPLYAAQTNESVCLTVIDSTISEIITLYNSKDEEYTYDSAEYEVNDYVNAVKSDAGADKKLKDLVSSVEVYGAMANELFGGEKASDELVSKLPDIKAEDLSGHKLSKTGNMPDGITLVGGSLMLTSKTSFRVYVKRNGSVTVPKVVINNETADAVLKGGDYYYYEVKDISAQELSKTQTLVIGNCTLKFDALTYVHSVLSDPDESQDLINTAKAIYAYSQSADAYFSTST